jgi:hypothetical protein
LSGVRSSVALPHLRVSMMRDRSVFEVVRAIEVMHRQPNYHDWSAYDMARFLVERYHWPLSDSGRRQTPSEKVP